MLLEKYQLQLIFKGDHPRFNYHWQISAMELSCCFLLDCGSLIKSQLTEFSHYVNPLPSSKNMASYNLLRHKQTNYTLV